MMDVYNIILLFTLWFLFQISLNNLFVFVQPVCWTAHVFGPTGLVFSKVVVFTYLSKYRVIIIDRKDGQNYENNTQVVISLN